MSVCALSVPVSSLSPGRRCRTFSDAGILGCVSINSNTEEDDVVEGKMVAEGVNKETKLPAKKKRKKGLRIKGKRRRKKLILAKKFSKDLGSGRPVADAPALLASSAPEQDEESLFESNIDKQIYLPSTRAKTSIVWHFFHVDPQYTWRAICNLCEKSVSRGKPGSHLGTSTLQRHLQARHSPHWTRANKFGATNGEEDFTLDLSLSPSSPESNGSFEYIPTDSLDENRMGKKRDKSASDALRAKRGRFLIKSNIVKHALIPGTRAKTSAVWNFFYTDPQHVSRAVCNICKRSVSRGRPGSHLGTSTLQRHLQATHPIHWAVANKDNGAIGNGLDETETESSDLLNDTLHGEKSSGSQDLTAEDLSDSDTDEPPVLEVEPRSESPVVPVAEQANLVHAQERETTPPPCENSASSQISQALIQMIVEDMHPYNYFSTPAFQRFLQIVAPDYRLPSETYFFTKAVPQLYDSVREKIFLTLENVQSQKIHLTVDIWTHDPSTDYFIVTVHWVSLETASSPGSGGTSSFRKWAVLCVTGLAKDCLITNILQELNDQIGLWLSPNFLIPSFIVSDNSSNVVHAIKGGGFTHVPCFLHCLNMVIQDFFCEHKSIENMLVAARKTCHHFSHSVKARQILQEFQNDHQLPWKNLKQDEGGHWISTFYMLKWLLEHCYSVHHSLGRASGVVLTSLQWTLMTHVCDILKPFEEATQKVSVKTTGLNQVLPLIHHLLFSLQRLREDFQVRGITQALNLVDSLSLKLETDALLSAMLKSKHCILATLLDPCFKNSLEDFFPQGADLETYKQILAEEVCNYMESSPGACQIATSEASGPLVRLGTDSFTSVKEGTSNSGSMDSSAADSVALGSKSFLFPSAVAVVDEYFKEKYSELSGRHDPLVYWQRKVSIWPALSQVAIQYLSCPMCSWQSECMFTTNSHFHPKQVMNMDFDNIEQLIFLKMNLENVNYDYSTLILSWDPENKAVQNNEKEILP